jgi:hypothetical protein
MLLPGPANDFKPRSVIFNATKERPNSRNDEAFFAFAHPTGPSTRTPSEKPVPTTLRRVAAAQLTSRGR